MADFDQTPYNLTADPLAGSAGGDASGVTDALKRLRGLQGALQSGQIDYGTYQQLFNSFDPGAMQAVQQFTGSGSNSATAGNAAGAPQFAQLSNLGGQDLSTYESLFKNLTGAAPGQSDLSGYFNNVGNILGSGPTSYADVNSALNTYITNTDQPQIKAYQTQQATDALNTADTTAQDLINKQNAATVNQLTSPAVMQQIEGAYNQNGLLNSGAFSQGLGDTLANAAQGNISSALGSITLPGINNIEGIATNPYQNTENNLNSNLQNFGNNQNQYNDFQIQQQLAQQLAQLGQPSTLQKYAPLIQGALQGGGAAASGNSYLCTHMKKLGLMTQDEVNAVHKKIFPCAFLHPLDLIAYAVVAPTFILVANEWMDWAALKMRLCDDIIRCKSSREAFRLYKSVCQEIFFGKEIRHGA